MNLPEIAGDREIVLLNLGYVVQDNILVFGGSGDKQPDLVKGSWSVASEFLLAKSGNVSLSAPHPGVTWIAKFIFVNF